MFLTRSLSSHFQKSLFFRCVFRLSNATSDD